MIPAITLVSSVCAAVMFYLTYLHYAFLLFHYLHSEINFTLSYMKLGSWSCEHKMGTFVCIQAMFVVLNARTFQKKNYSNRKYNCTSPKALHN